MSSLDVDQVEAVSPARPGRLLASRRAGLRPASSDNGAMSPRMGGKKFLIRLNIILPLTGATHGHAVPRRAGDGHGRVSARGRHGPGLWSSLYLLTRSRHAPRDRPAGDARPIARPSRLKAAHPTAVTTSRPSPGVHLGFRAGCGFRPFAFGAAGVTDLRRPWVCGGWVVIRDGVSALAPQFLNRRVPEINWPSGALGMRRVPVLPFRKRPALNSRSFSPWGRNYGLSSVRLRRTREQMGTNPAATRSLIARSDNPRRLHAG